MSWHWSLLTGPQSAKMTGEQFRCFVIWLLRTAVECKRDQCWSLYTNIVLHCESKKTRHQTIVHIFAKYWSIFDIFSLLHSAGNSLQIQPNLKDVACEILVSKNCSDWQHSSSTPSARTVKVDWRAAAKQLWRDRNLTFSTSCSTICGRKDHFLHGDLGLKCPKRRLLKNWLKQTAMRDLSSQNSCWMMLSLFGSVTKRLFTLAQQKNSQKGRL